MLPFAVGLLAAPAAVSHAEPPAIEYKVKAAYLFNFTRYVSWPHEAFADQASPLDICVLGHDPFGALLDRTVADRSSQGRAVRVRRAPAVGETHGCHVVFISWAETSRQQKLLSALRSRPVLTVGETPGFLEQGGLIRLMVVEGTVRFEVNAAGARRSLLRISARLLELAQRVIGP